MLFVVNLRLCSQYLLANVGPITTTRLTRQDSFVVNVHNVAIFSFARGAKLRRWLYLVMHLSMGLPSQLWRCQVLSLLPQKLLLGWRPAKITLSDRALTWVSRNHSRIVTHPVLIIQRVCTNGRSTVRLLVLLHKWLHLGSHQG